MRWGHHRILRAVEKRYSGLGRIISATPPDTPLDVQFEDLDRFAREVIPAIHVTRTAAPAEETRKVSQLAEAVA